MTKRLFTASVIAMGFCTYMSMASPISSIHANEVGEPKSAIPPRPKTGGQDPEWKDPFALPGGVELRPAEEGESADVVEPPVKKVTAILITDSRKIASINHKVVGVGDLIDGEKVLGIEPDGVILEKGGRRHVIMLEDTPIQWTATEGEEHEK